MNSCTGFLKNIDQKLFNTLIKRNNLRKNSTLRTAFRGCFCLFSKFFSKYTKNNLVHLKDSGYDAFDSILLFFVMFNLLFRGLCCVGKIVIRNWNIIDISIQFILSLNAWVNYFLFSYTCKVFISKYFFSWATCKYFSNIHSSSFILPSLFIASCVFNYS